MNNLILTGNDPINIKNLYFTLGDCKYAVSIDNVLEVMKLPKLDYPQKLPNNIIGLLKFNNIVINILDIRFFIGIEVKPYSTSNKLIIIRTDESIFGLIADSIENIAEFDYSKIERIPFVNNKKIIDSLYHFNDETISIINIYSLENILKIGIPQTEINIPALFPSDEKSKAQLELRYKNITDKTELNLTKNIFAKDKFISFGLNQNRYCINLSFIKEVTNKSHLIPLPCSPDYIEGLMTLRGDFITVLNMKKFLNLKIKDYENKNSVIILESNEYKLGFLVDEIFEILEIAEELLETKHSSFEDSYSKNEIIINDSIHSIIDIDKILTDEKLFIEEV